MLRQLPECASGSVAMAFALTITAIAGMVGLSIDASRWISVRQQLQASLDGAVLAVASRTESGEDGAPYLTAQLQANWKSPHGATAPTATTVSGANHTISAIAQSSVRATFIRVLGFDTLPVKVEAVAQYGSHSVDVALALDVTGSMSGSKIDNMRTAAKSMTDAIYAMPGAETKVRVSIVPFAEYVNVGTAYRGQSWLSVENDRTENQCYMSKPLISKSGCTITQVPVTVEGSGTVYYDQETCTSYVYGPEQQYCGPVTYQWNGCVGSRLSPLNTRALLTSTNPSPGLMNFTCNAPLTRLTNDKTVQTAAIDALNPSGETYLPAGIMWGWRTISPDGPFGDSTATSGPTKPRRVLVLMTDGENTRSQDDKYHWGTDKAAANTLTAALCTEVKKDNIDVYTIAYEVTDPATIELLKSCSSGGSHFFDASDALKLKAAFSTIGQSLSAIRLAR